MIVNSKELLQNAKSGKYCILAPDYVDLDSAKTFVNTAGESGKANYPVFCPSAK